MQESRGEAPEDDSDGKEGDDGSGTLTASEIARLGSEMVNNLFSKNVSKKRARSSEKDENLPEMGDAEDITTSPKHKPKVKIQQSFIKWCMTSATFCRIFTK